MEEKEQGGTAVNPGRGCVHVSFLLCSRFTFDWLAGQLAGRQARVV